MGPWPTTAPCTHAASRTRRASGASRPASSTGSRSPPGCSTPTGRRSTGGSPAARSTPATTRSTGTSYAAAATSPRWSTTARSPGAKRAFTYAELLEQVAAFAGALRGFGVDKGDRVVIYMPMIPEAVIAMLACARLGAVHSVVFGGFAPHELAVRIDDARPKVVVSASCGIEPTRVVEYKPMLDRALELADAQARRASWSCSARRSRPSWRGPRRRLGPVMRPAGPHPPSACRSRPPTRSTCSTPPAPPASPRASCATTAGTRSRWPGRCANIYDIGPATSSGPPPTSAGWSATPTSSTRRCSSARPPCSTRASRWAPPTPARSGG